MVPWENRKRLIEAIKGVDLVVPQTTLDYAPNLEWLRPAFVVHGSDWNDPKGPQYAARQKVIDTLAQWNGQLIEPPYTGGISTTEIIKVGSFGQLALCAFGCALIRQYSTCSCSQLSFFGVLLRPPQSAPNRRSDRSVRRALRAQAPHDSISYYYFMGPDAKMNSGVVIIIACLVLHSTPSQSRCDVDSAALFSGLQTSYTIHNAAVDRRTPHVLAEQKASCLGLAAIPLRQG